MYRFAGENWRGPDAAPLLIERFIHGNDEPEVRAALIAALQHTNGDWSEASLAFKVEPEEHVREVMADVLRHAESDAAWIGLNWLPMMTVPMSEALPCDRSGVAPMVPLAPTSWSMP